MSDSKSDSEVYRIPANPKSSAANSSSRKNPAANPSKPLSCLQAAINKSLAIHDNSNKRKHVEDFLNCVQSTAINLSSALISSSSFSGYLVIETDGLDLFLSAYHIDPQSHTDLSTRVNFKYIQSICMTQWKTRSTEKGRPLAITLMINDEGIAKRLEHTMLWKCSNIRVEFELQLLHVFAEHLSKGAHLDVVNLVPSAMKAAKILQSNFPSLPQEKEKKAEKSKQSSTTEVHGSESEILLDDEEEEEEELAEVTCFVESLEHTCAVQSPAKKQKLAAKFKEDDYYEAAEGCGRSGHVSERSEEDLSMKKEEELGIGVDRVGESQNDLAEAVETALGEKWKATAEEVSDSDWVASAADEDKAQSGEDSEMLSEFSSDSASQSTDEIKSSSCSDSFCARENEAEELHSAQSEQEETNLRNAEQSRLRCAGCVELREQLDSTVAALQLAGQFSHLQSCSLISSSLSRTVVLSAIFGFGAYLASVFLWALLILFRDKFRS
jgi:hypothetical protein